MSDAMTTAAPDTMPTIDEIVDNFSLLDEWDDRYRYVIELGRALAPLDARDRNDANKVQGCASQVWLATTVPRDGAAGPALTFSGDSDAHIVRGLIAILFALFSGKHGARDPRGRRHRSVRAPGAARAFDPAALERLPLHGRAHPLRRARGASDVRPIFYSWSGRTWRKPLILLERRDHFCENVVPRL